MNQLKTDKRAASIPFLSLRGQASQKAWITLAVFVELIDGHDYKRFRLIGSLYCSSRADVSGVPFMLRELNAGDLDALANVKGCLSRCVHRSIVVGVSVLNFLFSKSFPPFPSVVDRLPSITPGLGAKW